MLEIGHKILGNLVYNIYWKRDFSTLFLNEEQLVTLIVDGDDDADFEECQIQAFTELSQNYTKMLTEVEKRIYQYYLSVCNDKRKQFGEQADELAPLIGNLYELSSLIDLKSIIVIESFDNNQREIGFVLDAIWEPELGVGVKCVNGEVVEVGHQDIVL